MKAENRIQWNDWHWQIENSFSGEKGLNLLSEQGFSIEKESFKVIKEYPFLITPYYLSLVDRSDSVDPVCLQSFPSSAEIVDDEYTLDPFNEKEKMPVEGLIHRFPDRVLVLATGKCAVNCRHCTRKNWITSRSHRTPDLGPIKKYISSDCRIREVLISGGDPLVLETGELDRLLYEISGIPNVRVIRLGTRVPVVLPMRVDAELCLILRKHRPLWINTQFNHPNEMTDDALEACRMLIDSGIPVSNQSVLLRGVNDSVRVCEDLFSRLQENMIRPYYMFLCDPVKGTSGLRTDIETGRRIEKTLRKELGGLALPSFVADIPGEAAKVRICDL